MTLDDATTDLLENAVEELGIARSLLAAEACSLALPIYIEIKRRQKVDERERMRAALEVAMTERMGWAPEDMKTAFEAMMRQYLSDGVLPGTAKQEQESQSRQKRK